MNTKPILLLSLSLLFSATTALADKAYLAGGCFWCMESDFEKLDGVTEVISGFTGGALKNPTYYGNHQGHYEAVEIIYDPAVVTYEELLDYYWVHIDPFDAKGQFCDKGPSYRTAVFVQNETERAIAKKTKQAIQSRFPGETIATPILDASTFWPIQGDESHHQDYYKNNPVRYKFYRWNCGRDQRLEEIWGRHE